MSAKVRSTRRKYSTPATASNTPTAEDTPNAYQSNGPPSAACRNASTSPYAGFSGRYGSASWSSAEAGRYRLGVANIHNCTPNVSTYLKSRCATINAESRMPTPAAATASIATTSGSISTDHPGVTPNAAIIAASNTDAMTRSNSPMPTVLSG